VKIEAALMDVTRLCLDTAPVVYLVERNPTFFDVVSAVFERVDEAQLRAVASITLSECLVGAYRMNQPRAAANFAQCLTQGETDFVQISAAIGDRAAQIRVKYNFKLMDALQIATAIASGCDAFLTNDAKSKRVTELRVLVVGELEL
jgi:predicted nucleic acid-binding protein